MSMTSLSAKSRKHEDIVMQGWLYKRGEHIKNWRPRYFVLFYDGALLGFKTKTEPGQPFKEPLNDFMIEGAQTITYDRPKANMFMVRCLQWTSIVERMFYAETAEIREKWISCIESVKARCAGNTNRRAEEYMETMSLNQQTIAEEHPEDASMASAILGQPSASHGEAMTELMSVADASDAAKRDRITMDDFDFLKVLGKGTFGKVILCKEKRTSKLYAIKVLKKAFIVAREDVEHTLTENRVLQRCKHPFLTQLTYSFQTPNHLCFVMEFANGGEMFLHLQKCETFSESRSRFYGAQITLALGYLHSLSIVYRDMKLENLLLDKEGHIKIADFGLCKEEISFSDKTSTFCGTPEYLAPEVLEDSDYGRSVDWWGLGVVMYEMMCGRLPFYSKDHQKLFQLIMATDLKFPSRISPEARNLLERLLEREPEKRLGGIPDDALDVCRHPFFHSVDWEAMFRKEIPPPYVPNVQSETDTSYFDTEFTSQPVQLSPIDDHHHGRMCTLTEDLEEMEANFTYYPLHKKDRNLDSLHENSYMDM